MKKHSELSKKRESLTDEISFVDQVQPTQNQNEDISIIDTITKTPSSTPSKQKKVPDEIDIETSLDSCSSECSSTQSTKNNMVC